ncbi:helix-turn-helix domain-containing protein [Clostridium neonatale]|uniref:helix-turn-helix domain-containing protein n=1 Tax=Clostridium neonatale TaxID=137838 RepID=UPI00291B42FF|nr:helix-turn-helix transcriptional regulator [Clostridium neonatale]CAI3202453.1 Helix-turn-helix transcriptional regulator [Clostridium neonatale]CAI3211243.1 Helix-turn-helix transcriptional regulator [Clostridium neonatale]
MAKEVGEKLKELRKDTKLSIYKVAKKVHISGNYLSLLERGINAPSDVIIFNLAEFYNINPEVIFKWYNRILLPSDKQLESMPSLKKIMTELSIDPRLSDDEKNEISKCIYQIANDVLKGEK